MYPELPKPGAKLVPLPLCEGPKLAPFDFKGPQKIEFLEHIGSGLHSHVYKVKIHGEVYALKLFRFVSEASWFPTAEDFDQDRVGWSAMYQYSDPFNAECRAFARLQETGHQDLAVECFGYVLLDDENTRAAKSVREYGDGNRQDMSANTHWIGSDLSAYWHASRLFPRQDGTMPPLRGIVKAFGQTPDGQLTNHEFRTYFTKIKQIQQLGIFQIDPSERQLIDGKHADFSTAVTTPHYATNPEMNPAIEPEWVKKMEGQLFQFVMKDYWDYNQMLQEQFNCNNEYKHFYTLQKRLIDFRRARNRPVDPEAEMAVREPDPEGYRRIIPTAWALSSQKTLASKYDLREKAQHKVPWAYVDPRKYDWRQAHGRNIAKTKKRGRGNRRGRPTKLQPLPRVLHAKPPRWYLACDPDLAAKLRKAREMIYDELLGWEYRDGAVFPCKLGKGDEAIDARYEEKMAAIRAAQEAEGQQGP